MVKRVVGWKVYIEQGTNLIVESFKELPEARTYYTTMGGCITKGLIKAQFKMV